MTSARLTRTERSAVTRGDLLAAAERRFFVTGYHGTTLDDIADEAGYTKGAVYSTFKSKAGLFLALFDDVNQRRLNEIRAVLESHTTWQERLAALARRPTDDRDAQFLLLSIEFWAHAAREPELLDAFSARYRQMRAELAQLAPPTSPLGAEAWARVTMALSNGLTLERVIDPGGMPADLMAQVQLRISSPDRTPLPEAV